MKRNIKLSSLAMSIVAIVVLFAMLLGSTFAWFTDSAVSSGNIIKSGKLDVEMYWADGTKSPESVEWKDASTGAIFNYDKWEPGYVEVRHIKIENAGTLAFKYKVNFVANGQVSDLSDVIDVYYADPAIQVADRSALTDANKIGTLTEVLAGMEETAYGELIAGEKHMITLAMKMRENAGNEYQDKSIGSDFSIQLIATQLSSESDGFGDDFDKDAPLDFVLVKNAQELKTALASKAKSIVLTDNIVVEETFVVEADTNIDGSGYTIMRSEVSNQSENLPAPFAATVSEQEVYDGVVFSVAKNTTLVLEDIIVDGGAIWTGEVNTVLERGTVNSGTIAAGVLVGSDGPATVILNEGAVLRNNDGANAVNLGTRSGSKLIINGGEIINNHSAAGAIWGGFSIELNDGKINGNHGGIGGAIRAVTNVGNLLTMNGGEMNHNLSDDVGGAIWAGKSQSNNVYVFNGGEMAYNHSPVTGGAMYAGYYETVKIGGTFKMHHNTAPVYAAIRFHDHASLVMTGGEIYENGDCPIFLNNNSASITGGKISATFGYSGGLGLVWGEAEVDGVIQYNLGTNHNTAYLAKEFSTLKFTVNESAANFAQFNFTPAEGYVYTEGDELKLVCMNSGYKTYYDQATGTFRLMAEEVLA